MTDVDPEQSEWLGEMALSGENIGSDHYIKRFVGHGDTTDVEIGITIFHKTPTGFWCAGSVQYDIPEAQKYRSKHPDGSLSAVWTLLKLNPLHIEPSVLCSCGDHGFIRGGCWVVA